MFKGKTKISKIENVCLISLNSIPYDLKLISGIFTNFADSKIVIDMISQSPPTGTIVDISFTCYEVDMIKILAITKAITNKYPDIKPLVNMGNSKIQIFNENMNNYFGFFAKVVSVMAQKNIEMKQITTSEVDISILVSALNQNIAEKLLKEAFV